MDSGKLYHANDKENGKGFDHSRTTFSDFSLAFSPPTPSPSAVEHSKLTTLSELTLSFTPPPSPTITSEPPLTSDGFFWEPSTFRTSYTFQPTPSEQAGALPSPTPIPSDQEASPSSTASTGGTDEDTPVLEQNHADHTAVYAAAGIIPVILLAIGMFIFFCMRKRRKQKQFSGTQAKENEMRGKSTQEVSAYMAPPVPIAREPSYTDPPRHPPPDNPQPVILGPISAGRGGNYFTGIDTSDTVSMQSNERAGLGNPFADANSLNDEPPPPYRPRSIVPLSRDVSLRSCVQPPISPQIYPIDHHRNERLSSPFDDPEDDEAVSNLSEREGEMDRLSAVSDMSYQKYPVVNRPDV
jgi:hypothetical protein